MTETQLAKTVFLSLFGLIALGAGLQSRSSIFEGAPSQGLWRDLRLWALILVVIHAAVYAMY